MHWTRVFTQGPKRSNDSNKSLRRGSWHLSTVSTLEAQLQSVILKKGELNNDIAVGSTEKGNQANVLQIKMLNFIMFSFHLHLQWKPGAGSRLSSGCSS